MQDIAWYRQLLTPFAHGSVELTLPCLPCGWVIRFAITVAYQLSWQRWGIKLILRFLWESFAMLSAFWKRCYIHHCLIHNLNLAREGRTASAGSHCLLKEFEEGASANSCTSSNYRGKKRASWEFKHSARKRRTGTAWSRTTESPESWGRETAPGGKGERKGTYPARTWTNQKEDCSGALGAD